MRLPRIAPARARGTTARCLLAALLVSSVARAEGPGIKLSDSLVLHPGIAIGAGYDNNIFYTTDNPTGAFYLDVRPALDLATLSLQRGGDQPHDVDFRLHLGSSMRFLLSGNSGINEHYGINLEGGASVSFFPFGNYSFDLFDNYTRTSQPPYGQVYTNENINYDQNQLGLRLRIKPGGQRLEIAVQYLFGLFLFESPAIFTTKDDIINDFQLRVSWKFFPKTALYLQASEQANTYINQGPNTPPSAFPFRIVLGVIGLLTPTVSVNLNVGYANSFTQSNANYMNTQSYNNAIGTLELKWKPTLGTDLTIGYRHDLAQALIGTFYMLDTAYASLSQMIWRLTGVLRFSYERRAFSGDLTPDFQTNNDANPRVDNLFFFHVELTLPIKDWLYFTAGDDIGYNSSNCAFVVTAAQPIACNYFRNDVWLRAGVAY